MRIELQNDRTFVEIVPDEGARVQHLVDRLSGRELLLQRTPPRGPRDDYLTSCAGGWDELFPTDSPWEGYPDHGLVWTTSFDVLSRTETAAGLSSSLSEPVVEIERTYTLLPEPRCGLRVITTLRARSDTGPFLWAPHPMLAVGEGWRTRVPEGGFHFQADPELPGRFPPGALLDEGQLATCFSIPAPESALCEVVYVDGVSEAQVRSPDGNSETRVAWDSSFLRHLWIVTITGRFDLDNCLLLEPCTSRPYRLEDAIPAGTAASLTPGSQVAWWTEVESLDDV